MQYTYLILFFFGLFVHNASLAQGDLELGMLPRVNLSYQVSPNTKMVNSIETRHFLYDEETFSYRYALTDYMALISYRFKPNRSFNAGITLRNRGEELLLRFTQQLNVIKKYDTYRIGFRYAADQTIGDFTPTVVRFRYRISYEKPLSGDRVDPGEFYYKLGNEYLLALSSEETDLEVRLLTFLGYEVSRRIKIETGIDYRLNKFLLSETRNRFMWGLTWYWAI